MLQRKIEDSLIKWKKTKNHKSLMIFGARQVGKTYSIRAFGNSNYESVVEINFAERPDAANIFEGNLDPDTLLTNISADIGAGRLIPGKTLIFLDEIQECPAAITSLKFWNSDDRYDIIATGSMLGLNYKFQGSYPVGNVEYLDMHSLDFEEFLWALGYTEEQIDGLYRHMLDVTPLSNTEMNVMLEHFCEYMVIGGMPAVVNSFVVNKNYSGILKMQKQLILDYEEDITKYAESLDKAKILNVYRKIPVFLGSDNKKFRISKVAHNARNRDYVGVVDWLANAGMVNVCYCMDSPELPLGGNFDPDNFKLYFRDTGLLIGSLDDEVQDDLRANKNFNTYKGAIYENIVADMLYKQGYALYFFRNEKSTIEMDFFVRDKDSLIPVEVKANDSSTPSLNKLIDKPEFGDVKYGIKLGRRNIGWNGKFYTFPYFLTFMLKRWLKEK